jgi:phenylpropionate dioxygenase-like ring-hydroxylating dioxygenase large terminal subunit
MVDLVSLRQSRAARYSQLSGYGWLGAENVVSAPIDLVSRTARLLHTGFAHEGLFRSAPTQFVSADLETRPSSVETVEASPRRSWDVRRSSDAAGRSAMWMRSSCCTPCEWIINGRDVHVTVLVCTPETAQRTRLHTRMGVRHGVLTPLITRYVEWLTRRIVAQDLAILTSQAERIRQFGGRDFRVTADLPAAWYQRCAHRDVRGPTDRPLRHRRIEYRL